MTKRFLESDIAIHYYFYYLCNQSTMEPQAQPEIPLLQMLSVPEQKSHKLAYIHISHNSEENRKAVKKVGRGMQLKERSLIDSKEIT